MVEKLYPNKTDYKRHFVVKISTKEGADFFTEHHERGHNTESS